MIFPNYEKDNLYNLSNSVLEAFGIHNQDSSITLGNKIVLILLDGLGWNILEKMNEKEEGKKIFEVDGLNIKIDKICTVFPSTTATALTTLMTAKTPAEHKVLGYTTYVKEIGIINALKYTLPQSSEVDLLKKATGKSMQELLNIKNIGKIIREKGYRVSSILPNCISRTEFSKALYYNIDEFRTLWEGIYKIGNYAEKKTNLITLYIPDIDLTAHRYGPYEKPTIDAAEDILSIIFRNIPKDYEVIITADHGFIQTEKNPVMLDEDKEFKDLLELPPFGDARAVFMKSRKNVKILENKFENFKVYSADEIIELGLISKKGEKKEAEAEEDSLLIPDYVGIPLDRKVYPYRFKGTYAGHKGHHGALLEEEMEIPLIRVSRN
ncbi:PglZ domain-containing protein [Acidianus sulfidivorans JP7]|uniref:Nucleotide pyrophosphatase n=1 Tax=Acidianus sulfidivorans JP7 TaxID=619593 RepID=A0A2U9IK33_9CREN|nr:alkaline phosphatase family protein [Acidianus sulfidivorans]AWR96284.1 PglZ domain-containing protein [Acidianus sulfidivorans JP7]